MFRIGRVGWTAVLCVFLQAVVPGCARQDEHASAELRRAAKAGDIGLVMALLDGGADPDARDWQGLTPLLLAAQNGHRAVAELLIEKGAALELFAASGLGMTDAVKGLIEDNPRMINEWDAAGRTPLHR